MNEIKVGDKVRCTRGFLHTTMGIGNLEIGRVYTVKDVGRLISGATIVWLAAKGDVCGFHHKLFEIVRDAPFKEGDKVINPNCRTESINIRVVQAVYKSDEGKYSLKLGNVNYPCHASYYILYVEPLVFSILSYRAKVVVGDTYTVTGMASRGGIMSYQEATLKGCTVYNTIEVIASSRKIHLQTGETYKISNIDLVTLEIELEHVDTGHSGIRHSHILDTCLADSITLTNKILLAKDKLDEYIGSMLEEKGEDLGGPPIKNDLPKAENLQYKIGDKVRILEDIPSAFKAAHFPYHFRKGDIASVSADTGVTQLKVDYITVARHLCEPVTTISYEDLLNTNADNRLLVWFITYYRSRHIEVKRVIEDLLRPEELPAWEAWAGWVSNRFENKLV